MKTAMREEISQSIIKSLDMLLECDKVCESTERRRELNMSLLSDLEDRIKNMNEEIDELDRRKRLLSAQVGILQKAAKVILNGEMEALDEEPVMSKAEIVRDLIRDSGPVGITRDEIRAQMERQGQSFSRNFVYSTLARLRQDNEVTQKADRYFWSKAS